MVNIYLFLFVIFFFQAEDGIRDKLVTGVQTCALPICGDRRLLARSRAIIESRHWTISQRPLNAALHRLPPKRDPPRRRMAFPVGQQNPRPLDPACPGRPGALSKPTSPNPQLQSSAPSIGPAATAVSPHEVR